MKKNKICMTSLSYLANSECNARQSALDYEKRHSLLMRTLDWNHLLNMKKKHGKQ